MVIERHEHANYDAKITFGVSDALKFASNQPIIFDDPSGTGKKSIIFPEHDNFKKPDLTNSDVPREEHYYIKIGGMGPGNCRGLAQGHALTWTSFGSRFPDYEIDATDEAAEILGQWAEEQENE